MFVSDDELQVEADSIIRPSPDQARKPWYNATLSRCNADAYGLCRRTLAGRGFTPAQIAAWADGPEFQVSHALYLLSIRTRLDLDPRALAMLETMDKSKELLTCMVTTADGTPVLADNFPVSTGPISTVDDLFGPPAEDDDVRRGEVISW